jgi:ATP adenylyltransferase
MAKKKSKKTSAHRKNSQTKTGKQKSPKKVTSSASPALIQIGKEIWPMERDVLFRPDRLKYVRKLIKDEGCVFCNASDAEVGFETLCVHKTEHSMIMLNKFPYNSGHLLVVPRKHSKDLQSLSEPEFIDLNNNLKLALKALDQVYNPGGFNVGLNLGAVAGAGIPDHMHYHVIPRWAGDLNFFPLVAETKAVVENLETTFERLLAYFR